MVYDRDACTVVVYPLQRAEASHFGRCGEGPGDVGDRGAAVALEADTIRFVRNAPAQIVWFTTSGRELRRVRLTDERGDIGEALPVSDSTLVVSRWPMSNSGEPLLSLIDSRRGTTLSNALSMAHTVAANPQLGGEHLALCVRSDGVSRTVVAVQQWLMQSVLLSGDPLRVRASWHTQTDQDRTIAPTFPGRPVGRMRPRFREITTACNDRGFAVWARVTDWSAMPPRDLRAMLELRRPDGRVLYRGPNPPGVHPLAKLVAGSGDRRVFALNEETSELWVVRVPREN